MKKYDYEKIKNYLKVPDASVVRLAFTLLILPDLFFLVLFLILKWPGMTFLWSPLFVYFFTPSIIIINILAIYFSLNAEKSRVIYLLFSGVSSLVLSLFFIYSSFAVLYSELSIYSPLFMGITLGIYILTGIGWHILILQKLKNGTFKNAYKHAAAPLIFGMLGTIIGHILMRTLSDNSAKLLSALVLIFMGMIYLLMSANIHKYFLIFSYKDEVYRDSDITESLKKTEKISIGVIPYIIIGIFAVLSLIVAVLLDTLVPNSTYKVHLVWSLYFNIFFFGMTALGYLFLRMFILNKDSWKKSIGQIAALTLLVPVFVIMFFVGVGSNYIYSSDLLNGPKYAIGIASEISYKDYRNNDTNEDKLQRVSIKIENYPEDFEYDMKLSKAKELGNYQNTKISIEYGEETRKVTRILTKDGEFKIE